MTQAITVLACVSCTFEEDVLSGNTHYLNSNQVSHIF